MADSGANVCITGDASILVDLVDIDPIPLGVAVNSKDTESSLCTKQGFLPIPLLNGTYHYQPFLFNPHASERILSPAHVMWSSTCIAKWTQSGSKSPQCTDTLTFTDDANNPLLVLPLTTHNGLQYCTHDTTTTPTVHSVITYSTSVTSPLMGSRRILDSELWAARLGFCSEWQLLKIPLHAEGTPTKFFPHPLRFVDHKEQARIHKKPGGTNPEHASLPGQRFFMDHGFIRASTSDYSKPNLATDRVVESFDGYVAYLIIMDEASRFVWVFLRKSKEPPIDLVSHFLQMYGRQSGGVIRCDQGGDLAKSEQFRTVMMEKHAYIIEPTGADSPSQNIGAKKWNDTLAVTARALLYGSALPAKYWSAAITHAAYLHNRRVHHGLMSTPYERWYGRKPDLRNLRVFGSRVCVKKTGFRRAKLDRHSFTGIFIGYTATDANIRYIDVQSGVVKTCHHAVFDECWFHQPWRPPAAQLLYDLGVAVTDAAIDPPTLTTQPNDGPPVTIIPDEDAPSYPSIDITTGQQKPPTNTTGSTADLIPFTQDDDEDDTQTNSVTSKHPPTVNSTNIPTNPDASAVDHYDITRRDVEQIYFSPHHYGHAYEESFGFMGSPTVVHPTAGLELVETDGQVIIQDISLGTPCQDPTMENPSPKYMSPSH